MITIGAKKTLTKKQKEKLRNDIPVEDFEKLQHIPGNLEGHMRKAVCMPKRKMKKAPFSPVTELEALQVGSEG